ncbi:phasin family protein [Spiribacter halobius]|uniref:Phasin family protein n=1 Tax=Sediminicurvatus halobius TaxID=2182432 RepID=A0A2U2MYL5_9GAMM|nr:phasin family protein [Spiribacter halobius]PWG61892.1 phasin family protein [Spiribacter halobius]UEX79232.1 phasin family protein [Spiribacter halobius]
MSNETFNNYTEQAEKLFVGPARAYAKLAADYTEKLVNAQIEATRAYTEVGLGQLRSALEIKDQKDLQAYAEGQQKVARDLGERVKGDAENVVAMNQEFVNEARKLVESNVKSASEAAKTAQAETAKAAQAK